MCCDIGNGETGTKACNDWKCRLAHKEVQVQATHSTQVDMFQICLEPPVWTHHDQRTHDFCVQDAQGPVLFKEM